MRSQVPENEPKRKDQPEGESMLDLISGYGQQPKKKGEARIYTPIGRSGGSMPHPRFGSESTSNAQVMMVGTRVVVYTMAEKFTFSVYDGRTWGPVRSLRLDAAMTASAVEAALRRAVSADQDQDETVDR